MSQAIERKIRNAVRRTLMIGACTAAFLCFGIGGWAANTQLAGAIIAPGSLVVDSALQKIQHPTGGVLAELHVRDGSEVSSGSLLARLDETLPRATLAIVTKNMDELLARQARLMAEQSFATSLDFPSELLERTKDWTVSKLLAEELYLFDLRAKARNGQRAQLRQRITQLQEQIKGITDQIQAKQREIELLGAELRGVRELWQKKLVQINRVTALERDAARLEGERGALASAAAQAAGKISETELQILQIDQDLRAEVGRELADIRGKLSEFAERRLTSEDQLRRVDIRAPSDGVVHQLAVHTLGGVIAAGEALMLIVPRRDALVVEARIQPSQIDQVRIGHKAILRFSAFDQQSTPELNGHVKYVAADVTADKSGLAFYTVRISPDDGELTRLGNLKLLAGMPVEAHVQTGSRNVLSYLAKPLTDQLARTWRER